MFDIFEQACRYNTNSMKYVEKYINSRFEAIKETAKKLSRDMHIEVELNHYLPNQYFMLEIKDIIPIEHFDLILRKDKMENAMFGLGNLLVNLRSDSKVQLQQGV